MTDKTKALDIAEHTGLAYRIAQRYQGRGIDIEDLTQIALVAFLVAAPNYQPGAGKPSTYLGWHGRGAILRALAAHQLNCPRSQGQRTAWGRATRQAARLAAIGGERPSQECLAKACGCSVADLAAATPINPASLDAPLSGAGESGRLVGDAISSSEGWRANPEQLCARAQESGRALRALAIVESELENSNDINGLAIFRACVATIGTEQERYAADIAQELGITRQGANQRRAKLLARVRQALADLD